MTDEPRTITMEEAIPILQQQSADRLVLLRLYQSYASEVSNFVTQRTNQLQRDVQEVLAAQQARNPLPDDVITEDEEEAESDEEDSDSE